ncbi:MULTISPECIES: carbohydrate ABC transporter permease [Metabacillus]|uniref:ABC transporter permease n=2 Tax=Metabacillus TaxID=2675233 RepID=A0A179T517_9BACI|nr:MULTISPECIES: sugar ABC transporter permease [Metabacillus]OAS89127.1 ABC transporter permease [Metabacillus litoralis]QNF28639.1 sugar ABC transporter permease [Metabacillus sp. KUDC1714]
MNNTDIVISTKTVKKVRKGSLSRKTNLWCWLFILPNLIFYALFQGWPIVINWYYSMLDWSGLNSNVAFVGLENFKAVIKDPHFWNAYKNSFVFMVGAVPLLLILALFVALILNNPKLRYASVYRTLFFIPVVTTASIVGIIMVYIWGSDGAVNFALMKLNLIDQPINWLSDAKMAMTTVILIYVWKNLGMNMIYWLAGLQSIPKELYEAAKVDGAGHVKTFFYITLPQLIPIGVVILLLNVAGSLKVFDLIKTMTDGGPFFSTDVVSTYIYRYAFSSEMGLPQLGYASAAAIFFTLTIVFIGIAQAIIKRPFKQNAKGME